MRRIAICLRECVLRKDLFHFRFGFPIYHVRQLLPVADDDGLFRTGKRECPGREVHLRGLIDDHIIVQIIRRQT